MKYLILSLSFSLLIGCSSIEDNHDEKANFIISFLIAALAVNKGDMYPTENIEAIIIDTVRKNTSKDYSSDENLRKKIQEEYLTQFSYVVQKDNIKSLRNKIRNNKELITKDLIDTFRLIYDECTDGIDNLVDAPACNKLLQGELSDEVVRGLCYLTKEEEERRKIDQYNRETFVGYDPTTPNKCGLK